MEFNNIRRLLSYTRRAVDQYSMIKAGDRIAVGVSGGKDSLALLACLHDLKLFYPESFEICAITVDMGFEGTDFSLISDFCAALDIEFRLVKTNLADIIFNIRKESNPCALCSKMRRGILHDNAIEMGCNKIALGHHFDDVIDTFMLNLFNEGRIGTFSPVTYLSRKNITLIRPLVYAPEKEIAGFVRQNPLPVMKSACPEDKNTDREKIKQLLYTLDRSNKGLKHRVFLAIKKAEIDGFNMEIPKNKK